MDKGCDEEIRRTDEDVVYKGADPSSKMEIPDYNFCRIHKTLRVTPAMEAGLADMPRDAEWIVELVDATGPKPGSKQGTQ